MPVLPPPPSVLYHCPCISPTATPPPPHLPSSSHVFHPLNTLYFCEECDAIRCNRCVFVEVSGYYCPNCLFEVPSASVRAEKNRCARNCFLCPHCRNTLSVVPSDPPEPEDPRLKIQVSAIGEPPFFLYCNSCRWDSADVGIVFDKPTGLAVQLQKYEDSAPDSLEFDRLKEHFEPFIRASTLAASVNAPLNASHHVNPITAAASSALSRDIPGVGKYSARHGRSRSEKHNKDEVAPYKSKFQVGGDGGLGYGGGEEDVEFLEKIEDIGEVASVEQRWVSSWTTSLHSEDLKPLRIPLQSKKSKRCPTCRHILIKPEQKAQSVRYKIKLVAANYLPAISVNLPTFAPPPVTLASLKRSASTRPTQDDDKQAPPQMQAGKTYPFHIVLTNPLYDPITVKLSMQRTVNPANKRPTFAISLPTTAFPIAAYAEAWEYEDDDEMFADEVEDIDELLEMRGLSGAEREARGKGKTKTVGVLEKKANTTVVGGEVVVGRDAGGEIKFNMLVSYTYRSDDPGAQEEGNATQRTPSKNSGPEMKTFSFYTVVDLGVIVPREETTATT
ncbi:hypothetical protein M422DRAFT_240886 [Sphaerobolus stellatus SS14]|nr:hypothetical protein M422DRAFT_240886 [Sphaerobolus stellatus SS14]